MPKEPTYEDLDRLVRREVRCCVSALVSTLAKAAHGAIASPDHRNPYLDENISGVMYLADQAAELAAPILDYEEAAREHIFDLPRDEVVDYLESAGFAVYDDESDATLQEAMWQGIRPNASEFCAQHNVEPYDREVYEHWVVSNWLADKLAARGEKVDKDFAGLAVWARTTTGQSIACDSVIADIWRDLHKDD